MKFVRTKSGRILTPIGYDSSIGDIYDGDETKNDEVVDTSDNIEELCDEFVVCYNEKTICQFAKSVWNYDEIKYLGMGNDFYGAIWTDRGLIYVAKMNEKGEFELI